MLHTQCYDMLMIWYAMRFYKYQKAT